MFVSLYVTKAQQIHNGGFESWNDVGTLSEEPVDWNSFKTASGSMAAWVTQQVKHSMVVRPGTTGDTSCLIWSRSVLGIVANGVVTTGQVNAGSGTAADTSNYNATHTSQPLFSETIGAKPDSLVVWVRFKPANAGGTDSARIRGVIHDTYDVRDPLNAASVPHVVGSATLNFASTNNQWVRKSIPFIYNGPASSPNFILINMTTNKTPGSGSAGDSLYIDDLSFIYNPGNNVADINNSERLKVYTDDNNIFINLGFDKPVASDIAIYNINGQMVFKKHLASSTTHEKVNSSSFVKGIYLINIMTESGQTISQKIAVK